jgi:hypothetical protein
MGSSTLKRRCRITLRLGGFRTRPEGRLGGGSKVEESFPSSSFVGMGIGEPTGAGKATTIGSILSKVSVHPRAS